MKFLIVEHNKNFRNYYKKSINRICKIDLGIEDVVFEETDDGFTAYHTYQDFKPDYVIMELQLPRMNRVETAKEIKKIDPNAKLIVVTGFCEDRMYVKAQQEKLMDVFFSKPLKYDLLKNYLLSSSGLEEVSAGQEEVMKSYKQITKKK